MPGWENKTNVSYMLDKWISGYLHKGEKTNLYVYLKLVSQGQGILKYRQLKFHHFNPQIYLLFFFFNSLEMIYILKTKMANGYITSQIYVPLGR